MTSASRQLGVRLAVAAILSGSIAAAILSPVVREPLSAVLAIAVGAATVAYALTTERLLEIQTRPNVLVYMETRLSLIYLMVENVGSGEAFEVRLDSVGDVTEFPDQMVSGARFMTEGFRYLAPGQKYGVLLANAARGFGDKRPSLDVTVRYRSRSGRNYVAEFPLRLAELLGVGLAHLHLPEERAAKSLHQIEQDLTAIRFLLQGWTNRT